MARPPADPPAPPRFDPAPVPPTLSVPAAVPATDPPPQWLPAGTVVRAGDPLAEGVPAPTPVPLAPVPGVVGEPTVARLTDGRSFHAVVLDVEAHDAAPDPDPPDPADVADLLAAVAPADLGHWAGRARDAGLWADRWTCPDLLGQWHAAVRRPVDRLVLNLLDCDPWLSVNRAAAGAWPVEVAAGIGLLSRLTGAKQAWALVDQADPPERLAGLRDAAAVLARSLRIAPVENDYPQPDPTLVVYAATRRRLKPGRLPTEQGVLLVDAPAAAAIGRLLLGGPPELRCPVVAYDQPSDLVRLLLVAPGTSAGFVMDHLGVPAGVREVYAGSPLRQRRARPTDVLAGGEPTLFAAPPQPVAAPDPCVRCGWCAEGCPTRCRPAGLLEAAQRQDTDLARRNGLDACIECGLCTYVCPSRLPLLEGIRALRRMEG